MFCTYCGAPNPDVASFCNKCGKPMAVAPAGVPVQAPPITPVQAQPASYVIEMTPAASPGTPAPVILTPPLRQEPRPASGGTLTPAARKEFRDGLTVEASRQINDKCTPAGIAAWILTLIVVARFTITWFGTRTGLIIAVVMAFVGAGIVSQIVKSVLENKYLSPIGDLSDEMLVNRYNEAKADRRAAKTRNAISWAVIAIIGVLLVIGWLAVQRN